MIGIQEVGTVIPNTGPTQITWPCKLFCPPALTPTDKAVVSCAGVLLTSLGTSQFINSVCLLLSFILCARMPSINLHTVTKLLSVSQAS